ncbi:MAG: alpha/beta hydrolase [Verrucomicrobiales bacterium]|nr:alpha/beta hydrolase [Verrucomicrobiales bacterium]
MNVLKVSDWIGVCIGLGLLLMGGQVAGGAEQDQEKTIEGDWVGKLSFGGEQLRVLFQLKQSPSGRVEGVFKSPDQTPEPMPMNNVVLKGRNIYIQIKGVGEYRGKVSIKSGRMAGDWYGKEGNKWKMDLQRSEKKWSYNRPQTPKKPFVYEVRQVKFGNKLGKNELAGVLTLPKGRGPFAAVVLVSNFGRQDRDGTRHDHKPLWVIADYLAKKGIATLRYDDRGVGASSGTYEFATTMDLATDAAAAFEFLKKQPGIDADKVGLLGHGEGALIAPIVADKRKGVAFLLLLAAPAVRGDQMLLMQNEALARAAGLDDEMVDLIRRLMSSVYKLVTQSPPDLARAEKLGEQFEAKIKTLPASEGAKLVKIGGQLEWQFGQIQAQSPWFSFFLSYDSGAALEKVKVPVLALYGSKDLQVPAAIHAPALKRHLLAAGNDSVEIKTVKNLNHLFQKSDTGLPSEYALIEQTFSPSALKQIADWVNMTTSK